MSRPLLSLAAAAASLADPFGNLLAERRFPPLVANEVTWLQINLGRRCNQACHHCHVDAGPNRTETMSERVADRMIELMQGSPSLELVDLTGGAPELNAPFRRLVVAARALGLRVIDRCNLTILSEPGQEDLAAFLTEHGVEIVASLPCYTAENVDGQRGGGVFSRSIAALLKLNSLGYGKGDGRLVLDLVYNPTGPSLPPGQAGLEADYKAQLWEHFGVVFDSLITITNMPIARFAHELRRDGKLDEYCELLRTSFNPATLDGLMCRSLVSVSWDGALHDCDFNQMLDMPVSPAAPRTIWDLGNLDSLRGRAIQTEAHCFGCTAGSGSSCAGATT